MNIVNQTASQQIIENSVRSTDRLGYLEVPGLRHDTRDVLKQLQNNVQLIEDLTGRLGFVMTEVRSIIKR